MSDEVTARRLLVSGSVQGVGFRWFVQRIAEPLGVRGCVRNLRDGRVEIWAEGPAWAVERLRDEVARGPRMALVTGVEEFEVEPRGSFRGFTVTY